MAIALTLLYILVAYLSPPALFGPLAEYHLEVILAAASLLVSLPNLHGAKFLKSPQTLALAGLSVCIFISILLTGWVGGAIKALYSFFPSLFVFLLIVLNCRQIKHLRMVVGTLLVAATFIVAHGMYALASGDVLSDYIYNQSDDGGVTHTLRIRGLTFLNDPNDMSQVLVSLVPLAFFLYRKNRSFHNTAFVWLPLAVLLCGIYFGHSRGAILALLVVVLLALRRRVGTVAASVLAALLFLVATAASLGGNAGGRDISMSAGADRMDAWYTGLQLIKSHPVFGVGYERFSDYYIITAHNSVVVCAAELGLVGFFFWMLFVFVSVRRSMLLSATPGGPVEAVVVEDRPRWNIAPRTATAALTVEAPKDKPKPSLWMKPEPTDEDTDANESEIRRLAGLLVFSLAGYLVAGWFLSRAYVATLYLYGAMVIVLGRIAAEHDLAPPPDKIAYLVRWTLITCVGLLVAVSIILRVRGLAGH